jgi:hypothetical protein
MGLIITRLFQRVPSQHIAFTQLHKTLHRNHFFLLSKECGQSSSCVSEEEDELAFACSSLSTARAAPDNTGATRPEVASGGLVCWLAAAARARDAFARSLLRIKNRQRKQGTAVVHGWETCDKPLGLSVRANVAHHRLKRSPPDIDEPVVQLPAREASLLFKNRVRGKGFARVRGKKAKRGAFRYLAQVLLFGGARVGINHVFEKPALQNVCRCLGKTAAPSPLRL